MPTGSDALLVQVQMALGLSQEALGTLLGVTRRTIQRYQSRGVVMLSEEQSTVLADRLRPTHPDLADAVLALGRHLRSAGVAASPEGLAAIVQATATAGRLSPDAARPLVRAAFEQAAAEGLDVAAVLAALRNAP